MVSCGVFFSYTLRVKLMQIFQDVKRDDIVIVVFDFDELQAIRTETDKTKRLQTDVIRLVLESAFRWCVGTLYCKVKKQR